MTICQGLTWQVALLEEGSFSLQMAGFDLVNVGGGREEEYGDPTLDL